MPEIFLTDQSDIYTAKDEPETVFGLKGNDSLFAFGEGDTLYGGLGNDALHDGDGDDVIIGGYGQDQITGFTGSDHLEGSGGNDNIICNGHDVAKGGVGDDILTFDERIVDAAEDPLVTRFANLNGNRGDDLIRAEFVAMDGRAATIDVDGLLNGNDRLEVNIYTPDGNLAFDNAEIMHRLDRNDDGVLNGTDNNPAGITAEDPFNVFDGGDALVLTMGIHSINLWGVHATDVLV